MTIGMTSSLQGMQRAETQLNQVAQNIAEGPSSSALQGDTVDLSTQAVALIQAKNRIDVGVRIAAWRNQKRKPTASIARKSKTVTNRTAMGRTNSSGEIASKAPPNRISVIGRL